MKKESKRGRIICLKLSRTIKFNGQLISTARIEIDHINRGLDSRGRLKPQARTNFTVKDVEMFLQLLDGEYIVAAEYKGKRSLFEFRIDCPVQGRFYGRVFIMIFDTHHDLPHEIHTITLFPGW